MARKRDLDTSVLMELPIQRRHAKRLGQQPSACRLVVTPGGEEESAILLIGEIVDALRPSGSYTFIQPVNEFASFDGALRSGDAEFEVNGKFRVGRTDRDGVVGTVLQQWEAEAHVVFWRRDDTIDHVISQLQKQNAKWWQLSREGYEERYLKGGVLGDIVGFFARSHQSLELIGTRKLVCDSFDTIRKLIW